METDHPLTGPGPLHHQLQHFLQGEGAGTDPFAGRRSEGGDCRVDQRIRPNQHLRLLNRPQGPQGKQVRCARTGADNLHQGHLHGVTPVGSGKG